MTSGNAVVAARQRHNLSYIGFDEDTRFVTEVLAWIRSERLAGRLTSGSAVSLVLFDFRPLYAAAFDPPVDLHNGGVIPGALHLCNAGLTVARPKSGAKNLVAIQAHVGAITSGQLLGRTSVIFEPASRRVQIRLACLPDIAPLQLTLADGLAQSWSDNGMSALDAAIGGFHAAVETGGEGLLHDGEKLRKGARDLYRKALFIYLTHELGLLPDKGFKVVAQTDSVRIRKTLTSETIDVRAIGTSSKNPESTARLLRRIVPAANASLHVNCLACARNEPPSKECGHPPVSLRHRHVEAA